MAVSGSVGHVSTTTTPTTMMMMKMMLWWEMRNDSNGQDKHYGDDTWWYQCLAYMCVCCKRKRKRIWNQRIESAYEIKVGMSYEQSLIRILCALSEAVHTVQIPSVFFIEHNPKTTSIYLSFIVHLLASIKMISYKSVQPYVAKLADLWSINTYSKAWDLGLRYEVESGHRFGADSPLLDNILRY